MIETIQTTNYFLALVGLITIVATAILVYDMIMSKSLAPLIQKWALSVAFVTTLVSVILAFVYSDYFGIVPCGLCWLQRIFLFPQVLLLGSALYWGDRVQIARYGIVLSIAGFVVATYQHLIQMGVAPTGVCPAAGGDCGQRFLFEFGFVTFPLLAAIVFTFLIALYTYVLRTQTSAS